MTYNYNPYLYGYNNFGYYPPLQTAPTVTAPVIEQPQIQQTQQPISPTQMSGTSQPQTSESYIIWVQGEAGAKSYPVARGTTLPLFDTEGDYIYFKSVDNNGVPMPLVTMKLTAVEKQEAPQSQESVVEQPQIDLSNYVTKEKYEELANRVLELETKPSTAPTVTSNFTGNTFNNTRKENRDGNKFTL